jgi:alkyldihydroxyacetonephosphate synthase
MSGAAGAVDRFLGSLGEVPWTRDPVDLLAYSHDTYPLALRAAVRGTSLWAPDVVCHPRDTPDVVRVVRAAGEAGIPVVPFGGGSGIVGGALAVRGGVVVDTKHLAAIEAVDEVSGLVTVGAGINGQRLEDALNELGLTTGHYPQSLRSSSVGGWIAHRAIGTASTRYGGIERMVAGLEVVLATGEVLRLRPAPRTSTGIDLRGLFVGGEGMLGIVTRATLRAWPVPETRRWVMSSYATYPDGLEVVRRAVRSGTAPAIVRLYDEAETADRFGGQGLAGRCLLLLGSEGDPELVAFEAARLGATIEAVGGRREPDELGDAWWRTRFHTAGLLRTIGTPAGVADALEVSAPWSLLWGVHGAMRRAMLERMSSLGATGSVWGHTSHAYPDGANLYMILHATAADPAGVPELYTGLLDAAFRACVESGGSMSHHHGVGLGKAPWLSLEHGEVGQAVLRSIRAALDPDGRLNPGKAFDVADA